MRLMFDVGKIIRFQATRVSAVLVYVLVIVVALSLAEHRVRKAAAAAAPAVTPTDTAVDTTKPFFSLSSNRTFGTTENPRLWLDYRGVSSLDFRVYRVNDPAKFFAQLNDPHQMGQDEEEQLASTLTRKPSLLERVRAIKWWAYSGIRNYFREQLKTETRYSFNQKFRASDTGAKRTPLNVADYARVPLLNPNQLVSSWREPLPALDDVYDRRMVPLGKREPGVYLVEAVGQELRAYTIVVVTDLAMVEKSSPNGELLVYAADRRTGAPRADTQIEIVKAQQPLAAGRTNADGVFRAKIATENKDEELGEPEIPQDDDHGYVVLASQRENFAISDLESYYFNDVTGRENVEAYIYTDRPIYRPTHEVFFKGILRVLDEQNRYRALKSQTISVTVKDPNDAHVYEQQLQLSPHGTFHGELTLAEEAPLGIYEIEAVTDEGRSTGSFEVAEYKKPEYKVAVTTPKKFVPAGGKSKFEINARYFFGAPVANADVSYYIYRSRYYPSYWETDDDDPVRDDEIDYSDYGYSDFDMISQGEGKLDASGRLAIDFDVPSGNEDDLWDSQYRLEAQITDASRRMINGSASLIATRGNVITRATPDRYVYTPGQTATIRVSTTDYEGRPVPAKVTLKFMSRTYAKVEKRENEDDPEYELVEDEISSGEVKTDQEGQAIYNYPIQGAGSISIRTVVQQDDHYYSSFGSFIWIANEVQDESPYWSYNQASSIKLVPDKKSYRAGETAHVLAHLPKAGVNLLVTTELENVMLARHQYVPGRTVVLDVPIEANYAPNVFLNVTFVQNGDMVTGQQRLVVPARDKLLNLEIIPNKQEYKPRETASYTVLARDADGAPVRDAEVSLGVVDEAIYSIAPEYSGNIRERFYGLRYNSVQTHLSVAYYFQGFAGEKPWDLASTKPSYQLADFKNESEPVQPMIRKEFKDTAYWQPAAVTGSDGRATVKFRLPDNLTTWRATARAVTSDTKVGVSRSKVISRKDVILRLETPRFITQGDTVTLSGIVHNYLKQAKSTQISIAVNGAQLLGPALKTVTIGQQGEHRLDWQISAPQTGQITLLAKALTNTESDAVEFTLDVVPRGLHETKVEKWIATDETAEQQFSLELPANADLNSRQLRVEVAPSIAGTLFGALDYLTAFPYGCTEQTMSSFLPNIIVTRTLKEFRSASIRNDNDLKLKVERGRNRLYAFQHDDGGWGWWKDDETDAYMTAYVVDGLTLAKQAGYEIDDQRIARGRERLQDMLETGVKKYEIDSSTRAFMIYALAESGGVDNQQLEKLFAERHTLEPYGRAMLALALSAQKLNDRALQVAGEIEQTARVGKASAFWEGKKSGDFRFEDGHQIEGTAMSLKALVQIKPQSSLLPLAARWLVAERQNGYYWSSTKDTAFAIYGLIDYVNVSHELTPSYDLEVYVNGETVVAEHIGDASAARTFLLQRKGSAVGAANQIRIVKRGKGTVYFSGAVDYYTDEENVAERGSSELSVSREYYRLKVEQAGYNLKWTVVPLTGEIHSGDLLVVRLRIQGQRARRLMLEDPIPSGAEQLDAVGNLNLNYTQKDWTDWFSSREFRDRRTVFFLDDFDGDTTFQYALRVQVPGTLVVAPARVELMYEPWKNANTATGRFTFLD
jgi:alpha-2-macroglobulin